MTRTRLLEVLDYILQDAAKRSFYPLQDVYTVLGICEILKAVSVNESILSSPSDFIISHANEFDNKFEHTTLRHHLLIGDYITARIDIKNFASDDNDIIITEVSDKNAIIQSPEWLNKNGRGYIISSQTGSINITFQCSKNGTLKIMLRAKDIRNTKGEKIPVWIDYQKLYINDKEIFNNTHTVCHEKSFNFNRKVVDGEIITLHAEWIPYNIRKGYPRL